MADNEEKYKAIISAIEQAMHYYGFDRLQQFGDSVVILYRSPGKGNEREVHNTMRRIIEQQGKRAELEWSETNYQRLSITIFEPTEQSRAAFQIVSGTIGANIGGRIKVYVPDSDNKEVYVTLAGSRGEYIECDFDPLPEEVRLSAGFRVLVDIANKTIVAADKEAKNSDEKHL